MVVGQRQAERVGDDLLIANPVVIGHPEHRQVSAAMESI
jgi:hypothetical protein